MIRAASLLALGLGVLAQSAFSAVPATTSLPVIEAYEQDGALSVTVTNTAGSPMELRVAQLGCYRLGYGANLASCLRSCDGRNSLELRSEPEYALVTSSIERHLFQGVISHRSRGGELRFHVTKKGQYFPVSSAVDTGACRAGFDGTLCVDQMALALAKQDPIQAYEDLLNAADAPEAEKLSKLLSDLRAEFARAGFNGFLRQGHFLSVNLKNAAPLLCQLKSRKLIANPKSESFDDAFRKDVEELERSLDFMHRFNSLSPEQSQSASQSAVPSAVDNS